MPIINDPAAGAARRTPSPSGPTWRIRAKIGKSAVAPPNKTEKRSSVIADSKTGCRHRNRKPAFRLSLTPMLIAGSGWASCEINANAATDASVIARTMAYDHAGPANPYRRPPSAGPRIAENCHVDDRQATALG